MRGMDRPPTTASVTSSDAAMPSRVYRVGLRVSAIVLLLLAWLPAFPLVFALGPWAGVLVGLPSAACFTLWFLRTGARGDLVGVAAALATPVAWLGLYLALMGDTRMS
jgi:hypothetical protein